MPEIRNPTPGREETALEKKLDRLAGQIGQFGLGAGVFSFAAMAGQFTYTHFVAGEEPWQWDYVTDYLHFLITSITILVRALVFLGVMLQQRYYSLLSLGQVVQ